MYKDVRYKTDPAVRARVAEWNRKRRRKLKSEMIAAYGGACICCGESNPSFLTLDKISGGHRAWGRNRSGGYVQQFGATLFEQIGHRPDLFQLLCYNCNAAKSFDPLGCPHMRWMVA